VVTIWKVKMIFHARTIKIVENSSGKILDGWGESALSLTTPTK